MLDEERWALIDEECGVFGVHRHPEAARLTYFGLHALQHRGQESGGIAALDRGLLAVERRMGLIADAFTQAVIDTLPGDRAIGHVRYATTGASSLRNAQPLSFHTKYGHVALAHNGNLTNAKALRDRLERQGAIFGTETDTEAIAHLIARSEAHTLEGALIDALRGLRGAFSLVGLSEGALFAARDAHGVRPLVIGRLNAARVIASETTSLALIGATFEREIAPGELLIIAPDGAERSVAALPATAPRPCVFELVYFARPDSEVFGRSVYAARRRMGELLAAEAPADADVVVPVPDSGIPAALGYAAVSGVPLELGLVRSRYTGRAFIEPSGSIRSARVTLKLSPVRHLLEGKRVIVVDDSIVRGTTSLQIIKMLRDAGAAEVHLRIASPPTISPCYYGIDTRSRDELIAASRDTAAICDHLGADSLAYLSLRGLRSAVGASPHADNPSFCEACFTCDYPIDAPGVVAGVVCSL
jgi:amidophosphoribosyltransferase